MLGMRVEKEPLPIDGKKLWDALRQESRKLRPKRRRKRIEEAGDQFLAWVCAEIGREQERKRSRHEQSGSKGLAPTSSGPFGELICWAEANLKGKQLAVITLIVNAGGRTAINDLAMDLRIDWGSEWENSWNSIRRSLNTKLRKAAGGWRLNRQKNVAILSRIAQK